MWEWKLTKIYLSSCSWSRWLQQQKKFETLSCESANTYVFKKKYEKGTYPWKTRKSMFSHLPLESAEWSRHLFQMINFVWVFECWDEQARSRIHFQHSCYGCTNFQIICTDELKQVGTSFQVDKSTSRLQRVIICQKMAVLHWCIFDCCILQGLLAKSCLCPGFSTLVSNLITSSNIEAQVRHCQQLPSLVGLCGV